MNFPKRAVPGVILALAAAYALSACAGRPAPSATELRARPERRAENYPDLLGRPLVERFGPAPDFLLRYLREADRTDAYRTREPTPAERRLLGEYLGYLPGDFLRAMDRCLLGIYLVEGFMGGGMTDWTFDAEGDPRLTLVLNAEVLRSGLGAWIAYRDGSPFDPSPGPRFSNPLGDRYKGLLHTLTHEAAHMYDFLHRVTPYIEPGLPSPVRPPARTPFTTGVWKAYGTPAGAYDFPRRSAVRFFGLGPATRRGLARGLYAGLGKTPFASLYGSLSWAEDFAETFTWFYLRERLGLEYEATLTEPGTGPLVFRPLSDPAARARYEALRAAIR